jgi:hypothetical protein
MAPHCLNCERLRRERDALREDLEMTTLSLERLIVSAGSPVSQRGGCVFAPALILLAATICAFVL